MKPSITLCVRKMEESMSHVGVRGVLRRCRRVREIDGIGPTHQWVPVLPEKPTMTPESLKALDLLNPLDANLRSIVVAKSRAGAYITIIFRDELVPPRREPRRRFGLSPRVRH